MQGLLRPAELANEEVRREFRRAAGEFYRTTSRIRLAVDSLAAAIDVTHA